MLIYSFNQLSITYADCVAEEGVDDYVCHHDGVGHIETEVVTH